MHNIIEEKSYRFAVRVVNLCKFLRSEKNEYTLSRQLLRSGTSIGANIAEAQQAQSRPDFISKLNVALKECAETEYWIRLLWETEYLTQKAAASIMNDCLEVKRILVSIIKSLKA